MINEAKTHSNTVTAIKATDWQLKSGMHNSIST